MRTSPKIEPRLSLKTNLNPHLPVGPARNNLRPNFTWYFFLIVGLVFVRIVRMWWRNTGLHMILLLDTRPQSIKIRVSRWSSSIDLAQHIESTIISILFLATRGTRVFFFCVKRWRRRLDSRLGHVFPLTVRFLNGTEPYPTVRYSTGTEMWCDVRKIFRKLTSILDPKVSG